MSTENVFCRIIYINQTYFFSLFSDGKMTSNLFSSLHHYDICHIICSGWCCIQHPYTLLLCWFTHCTQHKCGHSRGSEPLEWIPQPSRAIFFLNWLFGKSQRMQSRAHLYSVCVKSCFLFVCLFVCFFAKWRLRKKRGDDLKFLSWRVEIIGEVRCSPHYDPLIWSESRGLLGMIYRVISQFS